MGMDEHGYRRSAIYRDDTLDELKKARRATWAPDAAHSVALLPPAPRAHSRDRSKAVTTSLRIPPSSTTSIQRPATAIRESSRLAHRSSLEEPLRQAWTSASRGGNFRHSFTGTGMAKGKAFASGGSLRNPNPLRLANVKRWDPKTRSTSSWDGLRHVSLALLSSLAIELLTAHRILSSSIHQAIAWCTCMRKATRGGDPLSVCRFNAYIRCDAAACFLRATQKKRKSLA
jgi:hypothetical protein